MDTPASSLAFFRCEPISVEIISPQKGRGVRAGRAFRAGETIERAPTLPVPVEQEDLIGQTEAPNVELVRSASPPFIEVVALRDSAAGEELCFHYREVWFKVE